MIGAIKSLALLSALAVRIVVACPCMNRRRLQRDSRRGRDRRARGGRRDGRNGSGRNGGPSGGDGIVPEGATPVGGLSANEALTLARRDIRSIMNGDRAAEFVRLAFHDCVGGICDGCVNTANLDNYGLDDPIENLEGIAITYSETLTRGDIWVLAGMTAAEETQPTDTFVPFEMEYIGRPSCPDPKGGPDRTLPSPHITSGAFIVFFEENFQFTPRDTTAILGAHTL